MSFDPDLPAPGTPRSSAVMRAQFNGLKDLIDALNAIAAAQVDGVTTLNPGEAATASVSLTGDTLHFTFSIPRGNDGIQGNPGDTGPQGPPFAQAIIDAVNTLNPGEPATAQVGFDGNNVHFTFSIPRGQDGSQGGQGEPGGQGIQGEPGIQGPPGEVTNADLNSAIATAVNGSSANTNAVSTLDTPFADPDAESIRQAYNALVLGLRRP